ncbi:triacylglycerol lipase [Streptacidiphilus sp. P02-A3a]|uniref:esterase/lipase family protein n=1 Tax=Streptacidiphilus sp. P02-A3a TaxID=2704468 RepID=UPI0015F9CD05|nr:alpha/beta fold hydrolase [Streptacidiphilus sp. P02-A3a]QMU70905.1 alpha/beta fold hydrolase [Streptacidiphilus sp. P02-A3a]
MKADKRNSGLRLLAVAAAGAVGLALACAQPATAASSYPVNYDFATGFLAGALTPNQAPLGANNWSCAPSAEHPYPVILVNGTFANESDNWAAASPLLANNGYCVFTFNYGGATPNAILQGTGDIATSAGQLEGFVNRVLSATGTAKVDLVGHSQGGMMPRYYIKNLGGAAKVDKLVALAPSNNGTTLDGITQLGTQLNLIDPINGLLNGPCAACVEQEQGSSFLTALNAGGETAPGVQYTVIESTDDEVVTPYTNAFLPAAPNVSDILLQNQCALDSTDHLEIAADPIALTDVLNALDPAHPRPVPCEVVLPVTGPLL